MPLPDELVQSIIDNICVEALHRPDLMYTEREEIEAVVRLTILKLERLGVFDEEKLKNLEIVEEGSV